MKICCVLFQSAWFSIIIHFFSALGNNEQKKLSDFIYYCTARRNKRVYIELAVSGSKSNQTFLHRRSNEIDNSDPPAIFVRSFAHPEAWERWTFLQSALYNYHSVLNIFKPAAISFTIRQIIDLLIEKIRETK